MSATTSTATQSSSAPSAENGAIPKKPIACIVLGMAGSGKTTFMQRLNAHVHQTKKPSYIINLDPAVAKLPYGANIDIRDTVKYKEVMKQYNLGPNGGIMTSLNLFATRFEQVMNFVEKRAPTLDYVFIDTPGQIEVFTWSASGTIITETMASAFPTVLVYIVDTPRAANPTTFMSNMLYACSILYKSKLPFVVVFNKIDVVRHEFALEWMKDYESFEEALSAETDYMSSLTRSMALVLDQFYANLRAVGVSAVTGEGMEDFFTSLQQAGDEYFEFYRKDLDKKISDKKEREDAEKAAQLARVREDIAKSKGLPVVLDGAATADDYRPGDDDDDDEYGTYAPEDNTQEKLEAQSFKSYVSSKK